MAQEELPSFLNCPICSLVMSSPGRDPIITSCGHTICQECLSKLQSQKCPICNNPIVSSIKNNSISEVIEYFKSHSIPHDPNPPSQPLSQTTPPINDTPVINHPASKPNQNPEIIKLPHYCVSRFSDLSEKYGIIYLLADGSVGGCFNDSTRMVMDPFETFVQYWKSNTTAIPEVMDPTNGHETKKLSILRGFAESLKKSKSMFDLPQTPYDPSTSMHYVKYWMRKGDDTILFRMDDRTIQVNFKDHTKIIIFWETKKMTMVKSVKEKGVLMALTEVGSRPELHEEKKRFEIAKEMLAEMSAR